MLNVSSLARYKQKTKVFQKSFENKVYLELILTFGVLIFFAIFAIRPTVNTIFELIGDRESLEKVNQDLNQKLNTLQAAQSRYQEVEEDLKMLEIAYPDNPQLADFLVQLEILADETSISLQNISFDSFSFNTGSEKESKSDIPWKQIGFTMTTNGSYANLQTFLQSVTNLRRIVLVDSVSISQPNDRQEEFDASALNMNIQGRIIFY